MGKRTEGDLVIAKNFPSRELAEAAKQILKESGIESVVQSSDVAGTGTVQGIDLYVLENDRVPALQLLESLYDGI
jgi:hypothetical protein